MIKLADLAHTYLTCSVHDGDIAPFLAALDIFHDHKYDPDLPITHLAQDRIWRTSSIMPMGGRITLERMTCSSSTVEEESQPETFVRINVNDKIVELPHCTSGPGKSCPLDYFLDYVQQRRKVVGDFAEVCGMEGDVGYLSFLNQE